MSQRTRRTSPMISFYQNRKVIIAGGELETAADRRQAQAKEKIRSNYARRRKRRYSHGDPSDR